MIKIERTTMRLFSIDKPRNRLCGTFGFSGEFQDSSTHEKRYLPGRSPLLALEKKLDNSVFTQLDYVLPRYCGRRAVLRAAAIRYMMPRAPVVSKACQAISAIVSAAKTTDCPCGAATIRATNKNAR